MNKYVCMYVCMYVFLKFIINSRGKDKENHKRVGSIYVIKIHVPLYVKKKFNFFGLGKINFQIFFTN